MEIKAKGLEAVCGEVNKLYAKLSLLQFCGTDTVSIVVEVSATVSANLLFELLTCNDATYTFYKVQGVRLCNIIEYPGLSF